MIHPSVSLSTADSSEGWVLSGAATSINRVPFGGYNRNSHLPPPFPPQESDWKTDLSPHLRL